MTITREIIVVVPTVTYIAIIGAVIHTHIKNDARSRKKVSFTQRALCTSATAARRLEWCTSQTNMNRDKARQGVKAPSFGPKGAPTDTPIARRVAFLRQAAEAYAGEIAELSAWLSASSTTLARENELSRAQINAYGSCASCGLPKDAEGLKCRLCGKILKGKRRKAHAPRTSSGKKITR